VASFAMASQLSLIPDPGISPRLDVIDVGDHRAIQVGGHAVACYRRDDVTSERVIATQLAETLALDACEIAAAFGMHPVTLSRLRGQFRAAGAQALISRKRGPKGPTKLTPRLLARFQELREEGLSFRAIARRVSQPGREISYGSVALALKATSRSRLSESCLLRKRSWRSCGRAVKRPRRSWCLARADAVATRGL